LNAIRVSNAVMKITSNDENFAGLCPADDFPSLRNSTYLNSAGIGLIPAPVLERSSRFLSALGTYGTRSYFDHIDDIRQAPRIAAARLFGCDVQSIGLITSVAEGMSQFAWFVCPEAGQNVVVVDIDHPSAVYPWLRVAQDTGAEVRYVRVADDPLSLGVDKVAALVDRKTAVISVSHVMWTSGYRFDLEALGGLARSVGAYLAVDATQSAGVTPLDVRQMDVDFIAATGFKWLLSLAGAGICYLRPELAERMTPIMVGNNSTGAVIDRKPSGYDTSRYEFPHGAARLEYGSSAHLARYTLGGSLTYLEAVGITNIERHVIGLGDQLIAGLVQLGAEVLTPRAPEARAAIVTARFPGRDGTRLTAQLEAENVVVLPRLGGVRFSPHLFNSSADIEKALAALAKILSEAP
jgi:selenocysteine lyase/cysteine desulfurase